MERAQNSFLRYVIDTSDLSADFRAQVRQSFSSEQLCPVRAIGGEPILLPHEWRIRTMARKRHLRRRAPNRLASSQKFRDTWRWSILYSSQNSSVWPPLGSAVTWESLIGHIPVPKPLRSPSTNKTKNRKIFCLIPEKAALCLMLQKQGRRT